MNIDSSNRLSKLQFPALLLPLIRKPLFFLSILIVGLIVGVGLLSDFPDLPRLVLSKPPIAEQAFVPAQVTTDAGVWTVVGQVSKDRLLTDLRRLTGVEQVCLDHGCYTITNRTTGSVGLQWAQDYVYQQLTDLGFTVQVQDWTLNGYQDQNLIVRYPGQVTPEDEIYFVAHMDGVNSPAADDNASGTVDLLELARVISHRKYEKTIVLLFSAGEENGTLGVKYYLDHLTPSQLAAIKYVINVDMVGYDNNKDGIMELFNGDQPLDFVQLLAGIILDYHINLTPQIVSDCG
jgi:hypothetical protein